MPRIGLCPPFPPCFQGSYEPFSTVVERIKRGVLKGMQVDWGAWAAVVTKRDITALIDDLYGTHPAYCAFQHLCERLASVRAAVDVLPEGACFALVADEF